MLQKKSNPAPRADAGRAREYIAVAANGPEHKFSATNFQSLADAASAVVADLRTRRIAWLARRYGLTPTIARALERHAFGEARQ